MMNSFLPIALLLLGMAARVDAAQARLSKTDLEKRAISKKDRGRVVVVGDRAVALYDDRVEFFALADGEGIDSQGRLKRGDLIREPIDVEPSKIIWYSRPVNLMSAGGHMVVCTAAWAPKSPGGGLDDFCGILSARGDVVYKFPVSQRPPRIVLQPLAISDDGAYAEVYSGPLVEGEDGLSPGAPEEILAWRFPAKLSRFPGPWKNGAPKEPALAFDQLLRGFKERQKKP